MAISTPLNNLKTPIFIALDLDDQTKALSIAEQTCDLAGGFKVGPRLIFRYGLDIIRDLADMAPVFLDFKFYDIPSTMTSALEAVFDSGVTFVTVHAMAGKEALTEVALLEKELSKQRPFQVFAVTLLTSFTEESLPTNLKQFGLQDQVLQLADDCVASGINTMVCSPWEILNIKNQNPTCQLVTPGIRMEDDLKGDQARIMTPNQALQLGSDALVIGRPVVLSDQPHAALKRIVNSLEIE